MRTAARGRLPGRQTEVPNAGDDFPAEHDLKRAKEVPQSIRERIDETRPLAPKWAYPKSKAAAEQANAAKSRFLAAASHDLRQPVHALSLFVAAMREWKRSFEGTGRSVQSLSQRIDKVLDVTIQREVERLEARLSRVVKKLAHYRKEARSLRAVEEGQRDSLDTLRSIMEGV